MTGLGEEIGECHERYLRHTQTKVNGLFAHDALPLFCVACNTADMRVRLSEIREAKGLILENIAAQIDVAISTVQRWEKQSMSIPSERLPSIADAYGCRIYEIFDDGKDLPFSAEAEPVEVKAVPIDPETIAPLMDAILPLVPPDPVSEQSLRALSATLAYGLELLGCSLSSPATADALRVAVRGVLSRSRDLGLS